MESEVHSVAPAGARARIMDHFTTGGKWPGGKPRNFKIGLREDLRGLSLKRCVVDILLVSFWFRLSGFELN